MIISSAPLRVSYLGGGTDYKLYSEEYGGVVVGSAIDKRVYVFINELSQIAEENIRFTYRKTESVSSPSEITHPVVRESLKFFAPNQRLNIATLADLPGKSGLGSSSAFTVALLTGLQNYLGNDKVTKNEIAEYSTEIERNILNEIGGLQDQYHSTFGNLRSYEFTSSKVVVSNPFYSDELLEELSEYHYLVYVGSERDSTAFANQTAQTIKEKKSLKFFHEMKLLAEEGNTELPKLKTAEKIIEKLSQLINESWSLKKHFGRNISNLKIESLISKGLKNGAISSKLCGAGNSGYLLFLVPEINREKFKIEFQNEILIQVSLNSSGATIIKV